ncbi:hypothetical protein GGI12_006367 [Dipsacomyces acuminosporus]|nr:hypothetical protein GGI12_006367 [Dipsacomyces acuminosporus]
MIAPLQGAFMAYMASSQKARRVLELGCYIGYSALWLAHGLRKQKDPAHLWTCEKDTNVAELAKANIQFAGFEDTVTVISQPAAKVLEGWDPQRKLDLVFIDANKSGYRTYYDMILDRELLSDHGQIVVDNVLFHGQVHGLSHAAKDAMAGKSKIAQRMAEFNSHVADDPRTSQVLLPVFDGMLLIQRKA